MSTPNPGPTSTTVSFIVNSAAAGAPENVGLVRHIWKTGEQPGADSFALYADNSPAVSHRKFGKGEVYVVWAGEIYPPSLNDPARDSFLRRIAQRQGAALPVACTSRYFYTNLLKDKTREVWYLLVMRSTRGDDASAGAAVTVALPAGTYALSEMIYPDKTKPAQKSAEELQGAGLAVQLKKQEVLVYRLQKQ